MTVSATAPDVKYERLVSILREMESVVVAFGDEAKDAKRP